MLSCPCTHPRRPRRRRSTVSAAAAVSAPPSPPPPPSPLPSKVRTPHRAAVLQLPCLIPLAGHHDAIQNNRVATHQPSSVAFRRLKAHRKERSGSVRILCACERAARQSAERTARASRHNGTLQLIDVREMTRLLGVSSSETLAGGCEVPVCGSGPSGAIVLGLARRHAPCIAICTNDVGGVMILVDRERRWGTVQVMMPPPPPHTHQVM